ncbi:MAG: chromosomal replication initiator protein DnaA [Pseudomonadota bacterium]
MAEAQKTRQWDEVKEQLRKDVGEDSFKSWIAQLHLDGWEDGVVTLSAPSRFICNRVETDYGGQIKAAVTRSEPETRRIIFQVSPRNGELGEEVRALDGGDGGRVDRRFAAAARAAATPSAEIGGDFSEDATRNRLDRLRMVPLNDRFRFEKFVVGRPNGFAFAAAKRIAEDPSTPFNPLFLYGQSGLGKTHLLHSIAWRRKELYPNDNILFVSAETFLFEFVNAVRHQNTLAFKEMFRSVDMLIVDDVQHIIGKNYTQEEFFHTFNVLAEQHRQIVLSADCAPTALDGLDERLRSRLGWGLVADLHPTDYELRLGILQAKTEFELARTEGLKVDHKVLDFLAHRISTDVRTLEGALNRLFAIAAMTGREATIEMAQRELQDLLKQSDRKVSIEEIQRKVAEHFNIRLADMHSPRRARAVARPRQVAMYLCKQLTQKSLPEIGQKFGGRDHTTVLHAIKKVTQLRATDSAFDDDVERLRRALEG